MESNIWWAILAALFLGSFVYAWFSLAPWFPTKNKDLHRLNKIANLQPGQKFLEIGCGDGRVCSYIAKKNPKSTIIGVELALLFYLISRLKSQKNCTIKLGNALKEDFSDFDVIYIFGQTETINKKLKAKLEKEMKREALFISYNFQMQSWKGKKAKDKPQKESSSFYIYQKS